MSSPTHARGMLAWLAVSVLVACGFSACETKVAPGPLGAARELGGQWNDTDSRLTAEALMQEALDSPWMPRFTQFAGRAPTIIVGPILNRTPASLNTQTFIKELRRVMVQSGQIHFVADAGQRQELRQERAEQGQNSRPDPVKPAVQEPGADFILQGSINTFVEDLESTRTIAYQVDLELIDIASNVKVWLGQKKLKKRLEHSKKSL